MWVVLCAKVLCMRVWVLSRGLDCVFHSNGCQMPSDLIFAEITPVLALFMSMIRFNQINPRHPVCPAVVLVLAL